MVTSNIIKQPHRNDKQILLKQENVFYKDN